MPRTSPAGLERAQKTADKYISRSGGTPRRPQDQVRALELTKHKLKIRNQKEEIDKLKRSIKARDERAARLEGIVKYLTRTAESALSDGEDAI